MSIKTLSKNPHHLDGWTLDASLINQITKADQVAEKADMRPCGCSIKLDLKDVVYPAFRQNDDQTNAEFTMGKRVDAAVLPGAPVASSRFFIPHAELANPSATEKIANAMAAFGSNSLVELFSTSRKYFADREGTRNEFAEMMQSKTGLLQSVSKKQKASGQALGELRFGKGHSIRAGGDFMMLDAFKVDPRSEGYTVLNNDTIITADSLIKHSSLVTVFTAFNNALNDLFLHGVTEELTLYPVYDGDTASVMQIQSHIAEYRKLFAARGVPLRIIDRGPLNIGIMLVGATVSGRALHEVPTMSGLQPGQKLLVTRHLGDLSFLSLYRSKFFPPQPHEDLDATRLQVLQKFCTPNILLAQIIQKYRPGLGESFDPNRHISFATDISGPGVSVLEEAAHASGVDVHFENLKFIDERSLKEYRKDHTSSTNGALVMGGSDKVIAKIEKDLRKMGYNELWTLGHAGKASAQPQIFVPQSLYEKHHSENPRLDFFAPEVHFDNGDKIRMPIFEKLKVG